MKLELTKEQQQLVVAVVLCLGGFGYAYYTFFWSPISDTITQTQAEIDSIKSDLATARSRADTLQGLKNKIADLNEQMAEAEKRLPKTKEVANIIDTLTDIGQENRVNLESITPGPTTSQQYYQEAPYAITLQGNYHSTARFLAALALTERIFHERGLQLTATPDNGSYTLRANFTLVAYIYHEGGAPDDKKKKK